MVRVVSTLGLGVGLACGEASFEEAVPEWEVEPAPAVSVGEMEGDSAYLFQHIVDVDLALGGELVVADAGLGVIRIFGPDGRFLAQAGRLGEGPGEFQGLRSVTILDDGAILAWDSEAARLTSFDLTGRPVASIPLERSMTANGFGTLDLLVGALPDGSVLVGTVGLSSRDRVGPDLISVEQFGPDGTHRGRVLETTGFRRDQLAEQLTGPAAFSPRPMFALAGNSLYHTTGERGVVLREEAGVRDSVEVPIQPAEIGSSWEILARRLTELDIRLYEQALEEAPRPDYLPALAGLLIGAGGAIWVKEFDPSTDALWLASENGTGGVWWVVSPYGRPTARVQMPKGFAPHAVTGSLVVGVHTDELGVQRVQVYDLSHAPI